MSLMLLWWEAEQLIDHIESRHDIWTSPRENMYLRSHSYDDDTACLGLVASPPTQTGPFRQWGFRTLPMAWSQSDCDTYLRSLACKWTDYGQRQRYTEFLVTEANIEPARAQAIAIGLTAIDQQLEPDVDDPPLPTSRELWPDIADLGINVRHSERTIRSYGITGGGWLTVRLAGGMLRVRASLRSSGKYGGGYGGAFEGFIRPSDGNCALAAAFLFGNDIAASPPTRVDSEGCTSPEAQPLPLQALPAEDTANGTAGNVLDAGAGDAAANTAEPTARPDLPESV